MSLDDRAHTDRSRAESFGSVAAEYDRFRASYPDALIADLANLDPASALDIACGTGKVTSALLACGIAVLGVEIDPRMAAVARGHGIIVDVAPFETWDDEGRTFDLITCGQGWHWIDPGKGAAKAARLLRPGGTLALFWNYPELTDDVQREFDAVYQRYAPELAQGSPPQHREDRAHLDDLRATGSFADIQTRDYRWHSTLTADEWIGRAATHSDHIRLPAADREALFAALRAVIDDNGGAVASRSGTFAILARNPEG